MSGAPETEDPPSPPGEEALALSVVIPTLGRTARLRQTLESLLLCRPCADEVIVVDGEGSESTREVVELLRGNRASPRLTYLATEPGLTRQRNHGLAAASGDVVVFFDDDMRLDLTPDLFSRIRRAFAWRDIVGLSGRITWKEDRRFGRSRSRVRRLLFGRQQEGRFTRFGYPRYLVDQDRETDVEYMHGNFMCARLLQARVVRFDEALTGYALAEDEDFSYRLSRLGRIRFDPTIVVEHERFGKRDQRKIDRAVVVNRTYLFRKNFEQTPLARLQFGLFIATLIGHRLVNGELEGARGLVEGIVDVLSDRRAREP